MFANMIKNIRSDINFFVFHGRETLVLEILWDEIKKKHPKVSVEERHSALINMLNKIYTEQA